MNRALFLDRDGVINVDTGYVHNIDSFRFIDGIFQLCRFFQTKGYLIIVITNQSGVARGYFSEEDYYKLNDYMLLRFRQEKILITKVYSCFHHPDGIGRYRKKCDNRKPGAGFFLQAKDEYYIDLNHSIMIGDKPSDIIASISAGITTNYFLKGRYEMDEINSAYSIVENLHEILLHYRSDLD